MKSDRLIRSSFFLREVAQELLHSWWLLVGALLLGGFAGWSLSQIQSRMYMATVRIEVQDLPPEFALEQRIDFVQTILEANRPILLEDDTLRKTHQRLQASISDLSPESLRGATRLQELDTGWELGVVDPDPARGAAILEAWSETALVQLMALDGYPGWEPPASGELRWVQAGSPSVTLIYWGRLTQSVGGALIGVLLSVGWILISRSYSSPAFHEGHKRGSSDQDLDQDKITTPSKVWQYLWLGLLFLVPWTSSPLVTLVLGYNPVSPLALVPLLGVSGLLFPRLWSRDRLPKAIWLLIFFLLAVGLSAAGAFLLPLEPLKGQTPLGRGLRALLTLGVGVGFYLVSTQMPGARTSKNSLKALYAGGMVAMLWGSIQGLFLLKDLPRIPALFEQIHYLMVIRAPFPDRVSGLAFEPSWFADQLVVLYLPLWLGSVLSHSSVYSSRKTWLSLELLLCVWGSLLLFLTFSRIGYLAFGALVGFLLLRGVWLGSDRLSQWLRRHLKAWSQIMEYTFRGILIFICSALAAGLLLGIISFLSQQDPRMNPMLSLPDYLDRVWTLPAAERLFAVARFFGLSERFIFWEAGFRTFLRFPVLGVGLGNSGLLFPSVVPEYGLNLSEIQQILDPSFPFLANPKNLWIRLLSEVGLLGTSCFLVWLMANARAAIRLTRSGDRYRKMIGFAGVLGIISLSVEGFSLDTFALPQMWILLGWITAQVDPEAGGSDSRF